MKVIRATWTTLLSAGLVGLTSCVSPFYGTARIEEGWHSDLGIAATSFIGGPVGESPAYYIGARGDYKLSYGLTRYLQIHGRFGLGLGYDFFYGNVPYTPGWDFSPLFDGALGFQLALPTDKSTPALQIEFRGTIVPIGIFLLGVGKEERFTFGVDLTGPLYGLIGDNPPEPLWTGGFVGWHTTGKLSVFAGGGTLYLFDGYTPPLLTLGIGCKLK